MKEKHMNIAQVIYADDIASNKLPYMESLYEQAEDEVNKMQRTRQGLSNSYSPLKVNLF
jgi:hypothetical protein